MTIQNQTYSKNSHKKINHQNIETAMSNTPLHDAVQNGNVETVRMLLNAGHDPNEVNADGITPLHIAAQTGNATIAALLLEKSKKKSTGGQSPSLGVDGIAAAKAIETINSRFKYFWLLGVIGIPLCPFLIGVPLVILSATSGFVLHYKLWKMIPREIARTTPGKAVGFLFIPFFNWYWQFVSYVGLSQDMNTTLRSRGIQYLANEGVAYICCILFLAYCILPTICNRIADVADNPSYVLLSQVVSLLLSLLMFIACIVFYKSAKDGAIALLTQEHQPRSNEQQRG
jgi:hypothetical protein